MTIVDPNPNMLPGSWVVDSTGVSLSSVALGGVQVTVTLDEVEVRVTGTSIGQSDKTGDWLVES